MRIFKGAGVTLLSLAVIFALALFSFGMYSFFAPKYTAVDNSVFKNSQQYNDGMKDRLEHYQESYVMAKTPEQKDAIRSIVRHEFASYPENRLDPDQRQFLDSMKGNY